MTDVPAPEVLRRHEAELRSVPGVTGVGLGEDNEGREVIVIFVSQSVHGYRTNLRPEIRVFPGQEEGEERSAH